MSITIGIRHEDKYRNERRSAITPRHVAKMVSQFHLEVEVERSEQRIFADHDFAAAGARLVDRLVQSQIIVGVKEISTHSIEAGKTYVFFSHVIKGQNQNMPMLARLMELGCNLIDFERIVDDQNRRLIFFGRFAGLAGTINTFWALGQRLAYQGYQTPFNQLMQTHRYSSLAKIKRAFSEIGSLIARHGLPGELHPFVIGITGGGNVAKGIHEMIHYLPVMEIEPDQLKELFSGGAHPRNILYKVVFPQPYLVAPKDASRSFEQSHYYAHPDAYHTIFDDWLPYLSVLINGIYWDARFPRIVPRQSLVELFGQPADPRLKVIGDITCDPGGSVEATVEASTIENPTYVYNPESHSITYGFAGRGVQVMAVDILPSELPYEASESFSEAFFPFIRQIAAADYSVPYDELDLPRPVKKGVILLNGQLTPPYKYLEKYL